MNSRCPKLAHGNNKQQNTEKIKAKQRVETSLETKKLNHFYAMRENAEM